MIRTESDRYYKGIESFLEGMSLDETKSGPVTFADDAEAGRDAEARRAAEATEGPNLAIAGRTLDVTAKIVSIQASEIPELNDAIATELGYEGGAEGMRAAIRQQIEQPRQTNARNQARANLLQALIDANPFEVPDAMIDQHLNMLVDELKMQQAYRGRDPRRMTFSPEQMADLRILAAFAAKGGLILDWVSKKENIAVTEADLEAKYQELADQRGQTVEAIRGYFVKDDAVEELRARLLEERTLDFLLERAKIVGDKPAAAAESPASPA